MKIIKMYTHQVQSNNNGTKGTINNPYSQEEFNSMVSAGNWQGGYVEGMGYVTPTVDIFGTSDSETSDSDSWNDPFDSYPSNPFDTSNDSTPTTGGGGNNNTGGNGQGEEEIIVGGNGDGVGNVDNDNIVDNAGEANSYPSYNIDDASNLMSKGEWKGGYIDSYILPQVTIVAKGPTKLPTNGADILERAKPMKAYHIGLEDAI